MDITQIGVIGMSVMGRNLALNLENNGYNVSIFNRTKKKTYEIITKFPNKKITGYFSIEDFINSLNKPRCIFLMIKSGKNVDELINIIKKYLNKEDILIDGGNSFYKDTIRRYQELKLININFIGAGISGGEEGALKGPCIMPGGDKCIYEIISPILKKIAASFEGNACVDYIGPDGSGHYVKMVHNGIEYGDMQLIAEIYFLLKNFINLDNNQISKIFDSWNKGELNSYLINITKNILSKKDKNNKYIIDFILDKADNKGTGGLASQNALELGVPLTLISQAVFARYLSFIKEERIIASKKLLGPNNINNKNNIKKIFIEQMRKAIYLGKIISYAQGFSQLQIASKKYNWDLNISKIAKIFRSGCIIQATLLQKIVDAYDNNPKISNILLNDYFNNIAVNYHNSLRDVVILSIKIGIPVPALSSAISYYDGYRSALSSANLIQAQRDYFGAHTYKRFDKKGSFHTKWY